MRICLMSGQMLPMFMAQPFGVWLMSRRGPFAPAILGKVVGVTNAFRRSLPTPSRVPIALPAAPARAQLRGIGVSMNHLPSPGELPAADLEKIG